jgi:hypothetical protein
VYAGFCVVSRWLARRGASCGCFGERDAPASRAHALVSAALALVAGAAAAAPPHGAGWILARPVLLTAVAAAAYATVLAYTDLPLAWSAWSGR